MQFGAVAGQSPLQGVDLFGGGNDMGLVAQHRLMVRRKDRLPVQGAQQSAAGAQQSQQAAQDLTLLGANLDSLVKRYDG